MVILGQTSNFQNCIKKTNKIPEYAREYKKEYLLIRGINKEFKYFVNNINDSYNGLFENKKNDRIKYFIKRFLEGQERGKLKDNSNFILPKYDFNFVEYFWQHMICDFEEDEISCDDLLVDRDFYGILSEFYSKIKIVFFFVSDYYEGGEYV